MFPFLSFFSFSSLFSFAFLPSFLPFLIPPYLPLLPLFAHSFLLLPSAPSVQIPLLSYFIILSLHFPSPFFISFHFSLFLIFLSSSAFSPLFSFAFLSYFLLFLVPLYLPLLRSFLSPFTFRTYCSDSSAFLFHNFISSLSLPFFRIFSSFSFSFSSLFSFAFLPSFLSFLVPLYLPLLPIFAHSFLLLPYTPSVQIPLLSYFIILSLHFPSPFSISFHPPLFLIFPSSFLYRLLQSLVLSIPCLCFLLLPIWFLPFAYVIRHSHRNSS